MNQEIDFVEDSHEYVRNGKKYTSVTNLLKKFGLAADYTKIPQNILNDAAARGKAIHKTLEDYIKKGVNNDPTLLAPFIAYCTNRNIDLSKALSEEVVYNDTYEIAGTIDFQYEDNGIYVIADFKTTSQIHWNSVTWQISIYNYMKSGGDIFKYYYKEHKVFWLCQGKFSVRDLPLIEFDEVEKLLAANLTGISYTYNPDYSAILSNSEETVYTEITKEINEYKNIIADLETKRKGLDKKIQDNMINNKIHQMTLKELTITLSERKGATTLDRKKVEKYLTDHGEQVSDFTKQGAGSVSLNVKLNPTKPNNNYTTIAEDLDAINKGNV